MRAGMNLKARSDTASRRESDYSVEIKAVDHFGQEKQSNGIQNRKNAKQNLEFYNLQNSYNITTSDKTTLTYAVLNMDYVNLDICKLDPEKMLLHLEKGSYYSGLLPLVECKKVIQKKMIFPKVLGKKTTSKLI